MRTSICFYAAGLARLYKLTIAEELAAVLPILDSDGLRAAACDCYRLIQRTFDQLS